MFRGLLSFFRTKTVNAPAEVPPVAKVAVPDVGRPDVGRPESQTYLRHRPILDREQRVVAYELTVERHRALHAHQWQATSRKLFGDVLLWQFAQARLDALLMQRLVFLPVGIGIIDHPALASLPRRNVVLQIAWHEEGSPGSPGTLLAGMTRLRELGFSLACAHDLMDGDDGLAALADYVTVDVGQMAPPDLLDVQRRLSGRHQQKPLMAMNVDFIEMYHACRKMRFGYFHGDFISCSEEAEGNVDLPPYKVAAMELLNAIRRQANHDELAEKAWSDPTLVLRLLRVVNSPAIRLRAPISDLKQAITYLGYDELYRWVTLLLFSSHRPEDRQPMENAWRETALVRGRFMEVLATGRLNTLECSQLFLVGVLSMIDKLFRMSMQHAVEKFTLPPEVTNALLNHQGKFAGYLELALACESGDQASIETLAADCGFDLNAVNRCQIEALEWVLGFSEAAEELARDAG